MIIKKYISVLFCSFLMASAIQGQNADINILKSINGSQSNFKDNYAKFSSNAVTVVNIGVPVSLAVAGFLEHNEQLKRDALYIGGSFIVSSVVTQAMKSVFKRTRPFDTYSFIVKRSDGGGYSFPSGHTSAAFNTATSVALRYHQWYIVAPSYIFATSVAWARMYQGVHYPTDVLAGAAVGAGSAWLAWKLQKKLEGRKKNTGSQKII